MKTENSITMSIWNPDSEYLTIRDEFDTKASEYHDIPMGMTISGRAGSDCFFGYVNKHAKGNATAMSAVSKITCSGTKR